MELEPSLDRLRSILRLEAKGGYSNRAVVGGLESYVTQSLLSAVGSASSGREAGLVRSIAEQLGSYSKLTPDARAERVRKVASLLSGSRSPQPVARPEEIQLKHAPSRPVPPLDGPIASVPNVGARREALFHKLGIRSVRNALEYFPKEYHDRSQLRTISELRFGEKETFVAEVRQVEHRRVRSLMMLTATLGDHTGTVQATWFTRGYVRSDLAVGDKVIFTGKVGQYRGRLKLDSPEYEHLDGGLLHSGRVVPVYRLTEGMSGKVLRRVIHDVVSFHAPQTQEFLPDWLVAQENLIPLAEALEQIHFPASLERLAAARRRLAFDEFLELQLGALMKRAARKEVSGSRPIGRHAGLVRLFLDSLPFRLTGAQQRAIDQILADLDSKSPMSRMLQGDVGSGKTVVAAAALVAAAGAGLQGAIMAPTEILAEQHYRGLHRLFERMGGRAPRTVLLTGSTPARERARVYEALASGEASIAVGTHALIQPAVEFRNLAVTIVDEQHRFGVEQRAALQSKGESPHLLVMTATPIPRSLALTVYGDLDLTVLDELPPGRQPIVTHALGPSQREWAYEFVQDEVHRGRQAFIIFPLVEESEKVEARAAVEEHRRLQEEVFPGLRLGLLHGRMKPAEKDAVMEAFRAAELDVLVSTSVVEVGIDVPNATVMLIEGADRFGLAQLHQFRGRVGRGGEQSFCLLLADDPGQDGRRRLEIVAASNDGFYLAEQDLLMRGPGEFYGLRQSGEINLKVGSLTDVDLLQHTRELAARLLQRFPGLEDHPQLLERVRRRLESLSEAN